MNILSLFDGMSGSMLALKKLGITPSHYFASEIDPYAIKISKKNFPNIIQLGNIKDLDLSALPPIDLLIGGSPCQDLSSSHLGKGLEGTKSSLFYDYLKVREMIKPKYFLLENVKNKWSSTMDQLVGQPHVEIYSSVLGPQQRPRLYWTNIPLGPVPSSSNIFIKDILEKNASEKYYLLPEQMIKIKEALLAGTPYSLFSELAASRKIKNHQLIVKLFDIPISVIRDNERQRRVYSIEAKSPTILARPDSPKILVGERIRKLTPLECERCQGVPDNYTSGVSDSQRYKMIGNGFTVDVIAFLLSSLTEEKKEG